MDDSEIVEDSTQVVNRANSYSQLDSNEDHSWNLDDEDSEQDSGVNTPSKDIKIKLQLQNQKEKVRMYYADWIRVISVHFVIFVHSLMNAADTTELSNHMSEVHHGERHALP